MKLGIAFAGMLLWAYPACLAAQDLDARQCQSLAKDFASYPEEMSSNDLRTLRQCVSKALLKRGDAEAPAPPTGVGIESQSSSAGSSDSEPPQPPRGLQLVE